MSNLNKNFSELVKESGLERLRDNPEKFEDKEELRNFLFNEDYFVIGYFEASEILKNCDYSEFNAIQDLIQLENDHFGESSLKAEDINSERVVNLLAYFYGFEVIEEIIQDFEEEEEEEEEEEKNLFQSAEVEGKTWK